MKKTTISVYRKINQWRMVFMALCMLFTCLPAMSQTVGTVGVGTGTAASGQALPVYTYYFYTYSQQIVKASDFSAGGGAAGQITGIRYYIGTAEVPLANWESWSVYIGHTAKNTFSSTSDWAPATGLTKVFEGTVAPVAGEWMEIVFDTPFVYDGTSNLIVGVDENSPGYSDSFTSSYFGSYSGGTNTGIYYSSDTTNPDPATPPTGLRTGTLARLQFIATLASCLPPSALHASIVGSTTATLEWTAPVVAPANGYQYYISTTNTAPPSTTAGTDASGTTALVTGLAANTPQYVWVRSKCGTSFSAWVAGTSFTTACNPVVAPLSEEFSTGVIPSCWTTTSSNPVANGLWKFAGAVDYDPGNTRAIGTFAWADGSDPSTINDVTLLTPYINLTGVTNPEVVFDYFSNNTNTQPNNIFSVDVFNGTTWTNIYVDDTSDENWRTITVPLTAYANTTVRLRFVVDKTPAAVGYAFYNDIALDNVKVRQVPSCIVPTGLIVEPGATTTSLSASWVAPSPAPSTGYQYYYSTTATTPTATVTGAVNVPTGTSVTITGLTSATTYYVWVRSNCGNGSFSEWTQSATAITLCDAANVPYTENFESVTTPALPVCTAVINEGTGTAWATATPAAGGFNSKALRYTYSYAGPGDTWFFTRGVNLTSGTSYRIAYTYGASSTTYIEKLRVGYGNAQESSAMTELADYPSVTGTTPTSAYIDFTATTTGVHYFGFQAYSALGQNYLYVDDISVTLSPTCLDASALVFNGSTPTTASVSWTASASNPTSGYQYYYSTTNTAPTGTVTPQGGTAAGVVSAVIPGLTANTTYYLWVRANCGNNDFSAWTPALQFATPCVAVAAPLLEEFSTGVMPSCWSTTSSNPVANGLWKFAGAVDYDPGNTRPIGTFAWADGSDPSTISDVTLLSPMIDLTGITNPEVVFDYFSNNTNTQPNNIFSVDVFNGTTWTNIYVDDTSDENWRTITVPLTTYANTTIRLRFVVDKTPAAVGYAFYNDIALDNVKVRQVPSCVVPTGLTVEPGATTTTLSASWVAPSPVPSSGYQYYYSTTNTTPATTVTGTVDVPTGTSVTISGLTSATTYYVWVRSNCGNSSYSEWTPFATATTLCDAANVPYTEDFEAVTVPALPVCSVVVNEGLGSAWVTASPNAGGFTTKTLRYNYSYAGPGDTWFFTRGVNLVAGTSYRVAYKYGASSTFYTEKLRVGYGTAQESSAMTELADYAAVTGVTPTIAFVDFTPATSGVYYFGFQSYSASGQNYLYVDDISVNVTPTCLSPVNVIVNPVGLTTATVTWTAAGTPSAGYQYYYSTGTTTPAATVTPQGTVGAGVLTDNITGLSSATTYNIWVRANCGNNDLSQWSLPATFTTLCPAATVPYTEDFESATTPALPVCTAVVNDGEGNSWATATPATGGFNSKALRYSYTYAGDADTWFFTRGISLTAGTTYRLSYRYGASSTFYNESLAVGYGTAANAGAMTQLADYPAVTGTVPTSTFVDFTPATTGVYYFGFQAYSILGQNYLYVDDIAVNTTLGSGQFDAESFRYYPNPVKNVLNISHTADITSVAVYNLLGQQVLAKEINATETALDMSTLADGTYVVNVTSGNSVKTIKVIKKQ